MRFHRNAKDRAFIRQFDGRMMGGTCARCGEYIDRRTAIEVEGWYTIPRIPIKQGGKKGDNCVIVCQKCYREIRQDGTKIIPYSELLYYESDFFKANKGK